MCDVANWQAGEASPTTAIMDSQNVKSAEKERSIDPCGYDAGKKVKGEKRHLLVDTQGLLLCAIVHAADIQDRYGQGPNFQQRLRRVCRNIDVESAKRSDVGKFVVLPKHWVVERTIAWLIRCRRLAKDGEFPIAQAAFSCTGPPSDSCSESCVRK